MKARLFLASIISIFLLSGCQSEDSQQAAGDDWVKEELLTQLGELRNEVHALRKEIKDLKTNVEGMENGRAAKAKKAAPKVPKELALSDSPMLGGDDASVVVVEFTDYQCPYCSRHVRDVMPKIKREYVETGKIKYQIADFPLSFHRKAPLAAVAARCAGEQKKYWEMHDIIFENQKRLGKELYLETAEILQLDISRFDKCLDEQKHMNDVYADMERGENNGVSGTPKFFIGKYDGEKMTDISVISGAANFQRFASTIENKLN